LLSICKIESSSFFTFPKFLRNIMPADDWDEYLLLDPYEESRKEGRAQGLEAGLRAGFRDGHTIGKVKALEIGIELGYMHSIAVSSLGIMRRTVEKDDGDTENTTSILAAEKRIKKLQELLKSIECFPKPDEMFTDRKEASTSQVGRPEIENGIDSDNSQDATQSMDIVDRMQRIRAKFKTILVQMKLPHLTLKKVMNTSGLIPDPNANISTPPLPSSSGNVVATGTDISNTKNNDNIISSAEMANDDW